MPCLFNISKNEFVTMIDAIKRDVIFARKFNMLFRENGGEAELILDTPQEMIDMLEKYFGDSEGYIRAWCFDYDFGELCSPEYASDEGEFDGLPETPEGLYDYLTE